MATPRGSASGNQTVRPSNGGDHAGSNSYHFTSGGPAEDGCSSGGEGNVERKGMNAFWGCFGEKVSLTPQLYGACQCPPHTLTWAEVRDADAWERICRKYAEEPLDAAMQRDGAQAVTITSLSTAFVTGMPESARWRFTKP